MCTKIYQQFCILPASRHIKERRPFDAEVNKVAKPANLVGRKFVVSEVLQKIFKTKHA